MPRLPPGVRRLFRLPFRTFAHIGRDVDDEVRFHLEMRAEELVAAGMSPEEARAEALRRFGDVDNLRAFCRSLERPAVVRSHVRDWLTDLGQDLRFAGRQLRRSPGFTLVAVLTLGLGIGSTTTIYSAVHSLLLAPLPYRASDRLVVLDQTAWGGRAWMPPTQQIVDAWRARSRTLEGIVEYSSAAWTLSDGGEPEAVGGKKIEPGLVAFLGLPPILGRAFTPDDALPGAPRVALIGEPLWRRRFGARRDVLGRVIALDGQPTTVVGVVPREFGIALFGDLDQREVFTPLLPVGDRELVETLARLRRGVTVDEASRQLSAMTPRGVTADTSDRPGAHAAAVRDSFSQWYGGMLTTLLGAVGLVLLVACANVANLLLMRAWSRQREMGIRTAIGAGRGRLIRQLLTESVALAIAGGALGAFLAWRGLPLISALRPPTMGALDEVRLDRAVLAASFGLSVFTGLLFGLGPALVATERHVGDALKDSARSIAGRAGSRRFRAALVVGEIALSTVLLISAGLLVRSLLARAHADEGLYPEGLVSVSLALPASRYPTPASRSATFDRIVERARRVPGVESADLALMPPWSSGAIMQELKVGDRSIATSQQPGVIAFNAVAAGYFSAAGLPLLVGQVFNTDSAAHQAVVSQAFARRYLAAGGWLGARIRFGDAGPWRTVVGVVGDSRSPGDGPDHPATTIYFPFTGAAPIAAVVARTGAPAAILPFVTRSIMRMDPAIHVRDAVTTRMALTESRTQPRFIVTLLLAFAGLALVLAGVGLYGVVGFSVRQRTHEIGVRVALGATAEDVLRLVLRQGLGLALLGIAIGLAGAAVVTRVIRSQLYGIGPLDPGTFVAVAGVLALVALAASYLPARAALRVDPVVALRTDG